QAAEPRHAVDVQHARVVEPNDELGQRALCGIPAAAADQSDAAVDLEVIGVRPEPALAGEAQPILRPRLDLVEMAAAGEQLDEVAVAACRSEEHMSELQSHL